MLRWNRFSVSDYIPIVDICSVLTTSRLLWSSRTTALRIAEAEWVLAVVEVEVPSLDSYVVEQLGAVSLSRRSW